MPRLIWAFTGPTSIGVIASYTDLSLYLAYSDSSDGCLLWSQPLLGTQWAEWWLPTLISVFTGHNLIGVMAAYADLSLYLAHSDHSRWLPTLISVFTGHTMIEVMAAYADLSLYWAHSDRSDGYLRWSKSLLGTQSSEWWLLTLISVFTGHMWSEWLLPTLISVLMGTQWSEWLLPTLI